MPPLSILIKPASGMCNMRCDYCFYCDEAEKRSQKSYGFMTEQTLKNVIRKTLLRAENYISYTFQGGEPTLRGLDFFKKVIEYQKQYNRKHIQIYNSLQTNGFAIDESWCEFLKENHFLVGLSVDGTENTHNLLRHDKLGNPTFSQVSFAADLMNLYDVQYNILTVVTSEIAANINEIYNYYHDRGWKYQQYIACLDPLNAAHAQTAFALTPKAYGQFLVDLFNLWYHDVLKNRQPFIRQFENYISLAAGYMAESCDQRGTCTVQYAIEADGSVYPCDFYILDDYRLGNLNECRLDVIDAKRKEIGFIERSYELDPQCIQCPYYRLCRGGCQRNRDYNETIGKYQNYFCEGYRYFFSECYDKMIELA